MAHSLQVFVYGTLKPGERNYAAYCAGKTIAEQPALTQGHLYALPLGYPALIQGSGIVYGYLFSLAHPQVLADLDALEDYQPNRAAAENHYTRAQVAVWDRTHQSLGLAWAYCMTLAQMQNLGGTLLPNGEWTGQVQK